MHTTPDASPETPAAQNANLSETVMHELVLSQHTNQLGTLFGGQMMAWVDICGAICAQRYTQGEVVTASIDRMDFLAPPRLGNVIRLKSRVTWTGRSSLEVRVIADIIHPMENREERATEAYISFVAVEKTGKTRRVAPLVLETARDRENFEAGQERRELREEFRRKKAERALQRQNEATEQG